LKKRVLIPPALRRSRITGGKDGAPFGNRNAFKHGGRTRERRALRAEIRNHIRRSRELIEALVDSHIPHPPSSGGWEEGAITNACSLFDTR
jgi:hypothetical protein